MATKNKYDRQLRLWGAEGQKALSEAAVILVHPTAVGTETLKNLVLPAIGSFCIIDDEAVTTSPVSLSSNFFGFRATADEDAGGGDGGDVEMTDGPTHLTEDAMEVENGDDGTSCGADRRAALACAQMKELNPDVKGTYQTVSSLLDREDFGPILESAFSSLSSGQESRQRRLVIASDMPPKSLRAVASWCWSHVVPLVIVKSYGLIGAVRLQIPHLPILAREAAGGGALPDLRLVPGSDGKLFPGLQKLVDETQLAELDDAQHSHVPYVVILVKAMEKWRQQQPAQSDSAPALPRSMKEKADFRDLIKSMSRNWDDEVNFQEAHENAYLAYSPASLPYEVSTVMDRVVALSSSGVEPKAVCGAMDADKFHTLVVALKRFLDENNGCPPLRGTIPDMTAATAPYIALQEAYRSQAEADRGRLASILEAMAKSKEGALVTTAPEISKEELEMFCKNISSIRLLETRSYEKEVVPGPSPDPEVAEDLRDAAFDPYEVPEHTPLLWYVALRACDEYRSTKGVYPGIVDGSEQALEREAEDVQCAIQSVSQAMGIADCDLVKETLLASGSKKFATEMVRYGNAELHSIASIVGGVASQEVVKVLTGLYVPVDNTYVFNGIAATSSVYRF